MKKIYKRVLLILGVVILLGLVFIIIGIVMSNRVVVDKQVIEYEVMRY